MEHLKPLSEITEPDPGSTAFVKFDPQSGTFPTVSLDDLYRIFCGWDKHLQRPRALPRSLRVTFGMPYGGVGSWHGAGRVSAGRLISPSRFDTLMPAPRL